MKRLFSGKIMAICFCLLGVFLLHRAAVVLADSKSDAIAIRVMPNAAHYSPLIWYKKNIKIQGAPQNLLVDGYEAVRDGRTVYVNAANMDTFGGKFYTNIYIISYNQDAENSTVDIFGQILANWKFNTNLATEAEKISARNDTKRLADLALINEALENYKTSHNGETPRLLSGSYVAGASISVWPSWQATLGKELGVTMPLDPVNKLNNCPGYDPVTCWNESDKKFYFNFNNDPTDAMSVASANVYWYQAGEFHEKGETALKVESTCGNGKIDIGEACDGFVGTPTNATCQNDCKAWACDNAGNNDGYHREGNICVYNTDNTCSMNNATRAARYWDLAAGNWGACQAIACDGAVSHLAGNVCADNTEINGFACSFINYSIVKTIVRIWNGVNYSDCKITECQDNYVWSPSGNYVSSTGKNFTGTCTICGGEFGATATQVIGNICTMTGCKAADGYILDNGHCKCDLSAFPNAQTVETDTTAGSPTYGKCVITACKTGKKYNSSTNTCDSNSGTCDPRPNNNDNKSEWWNGDQFTQSWDGSNWLPASKASVYKAGANSDECSFKCSAGYNWNGVDSCAANPFTISGKVTDAMTGSALAGVSITVEDSLKNIIASGVTDSSGNYSLAVNAGDYRMTVALAGYTDGGAILPGLASDTVKDFSLSTLAAAGVMRIMLTWGADPVDLDAHLKFNGEEVYYGHKTGTGVTLDQDKQNGFGPETITINALVVGATYEYSVDYFFGTPKNSTTGAHVAIYDSSGAEIKSYDSPGAGDWIVFHMTGAGVIY